MLPAVVPHRYRDGEPAIPAFGDDYTFTIKALIELYESTFDAGYLSTAIELNSWFVAHFHDKARGGFFTTSDSVDIPAGEKKATRMTEQSLPATQSPLKIWSGWPISREMPHTNNRLQNSHAPLLRPFTSHLQRMHGSCALSIARSGRFMTW